MLLTEVVATARAMAAEGLVKGSEGNVSAREGDVVHITPASLVYDEMSPDDLATLDLTGRVVAGERDPSSERAVHLAIYGARRRHAGRRVRVDGAPRRGRSGSQPGGGA